MDCNVKQTFMRMLLGESSTLFLKVRTDFEQG